ncbi:MAG: hypothetical protein AAF658_21345, partial [Myxococcota bacterium]
MLNLLSKLACLLPERVAFALGRGAGWLWYYMLPIRRGVALKNIERALGDELSPAERRRTIRRCFQHQALFGIEALRFSLMNARESERLVERRGYEHMQAAIDAG